MGALPSPLAPLASTPGPASRSPLSRGAARRRSLLVTGLGITALLAGITVVSRTCERAGRSDAVRPPPSVAKQATARRRGVIGGPRGPAGDGAGLPPLPESTTCWHDLERFNEDVTLETFRAWAAPLLASDDPRVRAYLKERLTELIGGDASRAEQVIGWAREAAAQDSGLFLSALRAAEAVHHPQVAARLVELGLDGGLDLERRAGFLAALDTQKRLEPAALTRIADLARDPGAGDAGWAATRTIGRVLQKDLQRRGDAAPYLDRLLTIGTEALDDDTRYLALSMPMHAAPRLDARTAQRYAQILQTEGSAEGREAAAHNLALSEDQAGTLRVFASAFVTEQDVCVRWALFRFAARTAGKDALPVLADMALRDPRFQADYRAFEQIYASGVLDFERVWQSLPSQDPHGCLDRHD